MPRKGKSGRKKGVGKINDFEDWDRAHHGDDYANLSEDEKALVLNIGSIFRGDAPETMIASLEWKASLEERKAHFAKEFDTSDPQVIEGLLNGQQAFRDNIASSLRKLFGEITAVSRGGSPHNLSRWFRALEGSNKLNPLLKWLHVASVSPPTEGKPRNIKARQADFIAWVRGHDPKLLSPGDRSTVSKTAKRYGYTFEP